MDENQNIELKSALIGISLIIGITVIGISVINPTYLKTFMLDKENNKSNDNKLNNDTSNDNKLNNDISNDNKLNNDPIESNKTQQYIPKYNITGHPPSTFVEGEEGNHDFPMIHSKKIKIPSPLMSDESKNKFDIVSTMAMGEEGNPMAGSTTTRYGEEGNPQYPRYTSNMHGEESNENIDQYINNKKENMDSSDYAGLGNY